MAEHAEVEAPSVPEEELSEFANSLFGYVYYYLGMHRKLSRYCSNFNKTIGSATFKVERITHPLHSEVLSTCGVQISKLNLCQKVCSSYSVLDYFKRFYYTTAFMVDLMFWWHQIAYDCLDLSEGPRMWKVIFRNNFDNAFQIQNGWQGLTEAGKDILNIPKDLMPIPNFYQTAVSGMDLPTPRYDDITMERLIDDLEKFSISPTETDDVEEERPEIEEQPSLSHSPSATAGQPDERKQRKRRLDVAQRYSDSEQESPIHSKAKMERRKRACDADPKPSGSEFGSPSKSKMDQRKRTYSVDPKDSDTDSESHSPSKAKMKRSDAASKDSDSDSSSSKIKSTEGVEQK